MLKIVLESLQAPRLSRGDSARSMREREYRYSTLPAPRRKSASIWSRVPPPKRAR